MKFLKKCRKGLRVSKLTDKHISYIFDQEEEILEKHFSEYTISKTLTDGMSCGPYIRFDSKIVSERDNRLGMVIKYSVTYKTSYEGGGKMLFLYDGDKTRLVLHTKYDYLNRKITD